jgi:hypothetical protein
VPGAEGYAVEIENDDLGFTLLVDLPPEATSFAIPSHVLKPATEYQVGVMVVAESGNLTVVEKSFTTSAEP